MKVSFYTFGCKVNQYETQAMRYMLSERGAQTDEYLPGDGIYRDAVVINSCTVTAESDRKLRQLLRRCRRENPSSIIVLTGCMPQAFPQKAAALDDADIILGNAERSLLPEMLENYKLSPRTITRVPEHGSTYEPLQIDTFDGRTRAFIKIQDGCNRFCSYCIIPYARGRVRSRQPEDLHKEVMSLAQKGYREIVLVGINLSAYGQDIGSDLAHAVEVVCSVDGIQRVRLGSLEPDYMTPDIIDRLAQLPKLCPQFHIALQSGCDATLKRMNRHYTTGEYAALCHYLRQRFPGCALTTDVMVGFPGETEQEFSQSLAFVESIHFSRVHVFAYSRRPGTVADRMNDQLPHAKKAERSHLMIQAAKISADLYAADYIGKTVEVLLETPLDDDHVEGHTTTYLTVRAHTSQASGAVIPVRITGGNGEYLVGEEVINNE